MPVAAGGYSSVNMTLEYPESGVTCTVVPDDSGVVVSCSVSELDIVKIIQGLITTAEKVVNGPG